MLRKTFFVSRKILFVKLLGITAAFSVCLILLPQVALLQTTPYTINGDVLEGDADHRFLPLPFFTSFLVKSETKTNQSFAPLVSNGKIVFVSYRNGNNEIFTMNADGSNQTNISNNVSPEFEPAWSPNGSKIVFRRGIDIYTMNADGTNQTPLTSASGFNGSPSWSPDGTKIAFQSNRDGDGDIYVMNTDGTNQIKLTDNSRIDQAPVWSPDGTKIVFHSDLDFTATYEIYVMNADGTNLTRLTNTVAHDEFPVWSPDGTKIAYQRENEIYVMNADGTNQTNISNSNGDDKNPAWSPDGVKIVFDTYRNGIGEIYVMNADGSGQTNVTNNTADDFDPAWQVAAPTAASITVGGRVMVGKRGLRNACLTVTNANGETYTVITNAFGYYHFTNVPAGATYIFSVSAKRYTFSQPTQVRNIVGDIDNINFEANIW